MSIVSTIRTAAAQAVQRPNATPPAKSGSGEFARMLKQRLDDRQISLSTHAAERMTRRGVEMDDHTVEQLQTAFDLAEKKGSREALFLLDNMAVIASVRDRVVKTALDHRQMEAGVFTQIDTTVVLTGGTESNREHNHTHNLSPGSSGWAPPREAAILPGGLPL
jgi:flagellar operon protein